ncbi:hypothetical protein N9242_01035 [Vicingaceae bacterium]|nr:hypothetical protein [Vicingaceae bacterium]
MSAISKNLTLAIEALKATSPNQKVVAAIILAIVVGFGWMQFGRAKTVAKVSLFGMNESISNLDLKRMQLAFGEASLNDFEVENDRLFVPRDQRDLYLKALKDGDAVPPLISEPRPPGFFEGRQEKLEAAKRKKKQQIRQLVSRLSFVKEVNVDYDEIRKPGYPPEIARSVAIVIDPGAGVLQPHEVAAVRNMISGMFADIKPSEIHITDVAASYTHNFEDNGNSLYTLENLPGHIRESIIALKIREALEAYGEVRVNVNLSHSFAEPLRNRVPAKSAAYKSTDKPELQKKDDSPSIDEMKKNPVNPVANQPIRINSHKPKEKSPKRVVGNSGDYLTRQDTSYSIPRQRTTQINVSVGVPEAHVRKLFQSHVERYGDSREHERSFEKYVDSIRSLITSRIEPLVESSSASPGQIAVILDPDIRYLSNDDARGPFDWQMLSDYGPWIGVAIVLMALIAFIFRFNRTDDYDANSPIAENENRNPDSRQALYASRGEQSQSDVAMNIDIQRQLTDAIEKDPNRAANVIKSWMKDAA